MQLRQRTPRLGWALVLAFGWLAAVSTQTTSPLSGTWKLNVAKSKYNPANLAPKSVTSRIEASQDSIQVTTDGVDSQGRVTHTEYTAKFDGKDYPSTGTIGGKPNPDLGTIAWRKIDDRTFESTSKLKGQVLTTSRVVIAQDGKSRTNTVSGKNAQGQTVNNTLVFEKQ